MRTASVVLIVLLIALAWFNPGMDAFKEYVETRSERILEKEAGDSALGRALAGAGGALAGAYVDRITERTNYVLFSTYTIDFDDEEDGDEWRFVGIAGRFIELHEPDTES
jgi:hypothetical protein